jgi:hypothetical protein
MSANHPYYNFYQHKDNIYSSKVLALSASYLPKNNGDIVWKLFHFENELDKLNLLLEPEETLQQLYLQRAIELRNNYDYLILNYSGGPDSHNILETFLLNNVFLDEIFIYSYFDEQTITYLQKNNSDTFAMFPEFYEAQMSAIPVAKYLIETYSPHTKITYVDNFYKIHKKFWENRSESTFLEDIKGTASVMLTHRHMERSRNPNFNLDWKIIKQKKKTAHIWGIEKPNLSYDEKGVYFKLLDHTVLSRIDLQHSLTVEDIPNNHELFYIHPSSVKLFVKQAHTINKNFSKDFFNDSAISASSRKKQDALAKAIYSFKIKLPYSGLKVCDLIGKYDQIPILKELAKTGIIPGYADMTEPLNLKLYADDKNSLSSINYDKFVTFIQSNLFKYIDKKQLLHTLCIGFTSKKYYIEYY